MNGKMLLRGFIRGLILTAKRKQSFCQRNALQNSEHLLYINEEDQSHYKCFHGGYLSSNYGGGLHAPTIPGESVCSTQGCVQYVYENNSSPTGIKLQQRSRSS